MWTAIVNIKYIDKVSVKILYFKTLFLFFDEILNRKTLFFLSLLYNKWYHLKKFILVLVAVNPTINNLNI